MYLLNKYRNKHKTPVSIVVSLPKAGTNLLAKAISLFPGMKLVGAGLSYSHLTGGSTTVNDSRSGIPIGVDRPRNVPVSTFELALNRLHPGCFTFAHIPFSDGMAKLLRENQIKTISVLRDPRDVVISHANYLSTKKDHFLYPIYQKLSWSERVMKSIIGIEPDENHSGPFLLNIKERFDSISSWSQYPYNYTTHFEKLVGVKGGGTIESQFDELKNIADHLDISHDAADLIKISRRLFGGTPTFHKGLIGNWKQHFKKEHEKAFQNIWKKRAVY
jgi:hypothetical protein